MTELTERSDCEQPAEAVRRFRGGDVSEVQLLAGDMRPWHLDGVSSDWGRLGLSASSGPSTGLTGAFPEVHLRYGLDVDGFMGAVESGLTNEVAGYALGLNERGTETCGTRSTHGS